MTRQTALNPEDRARVEQLLVAPWRAEMAREGMPVREDGVLPLAFGEWRRLASGPGAVRAVGALALEGMRRLTAQAAERDRRNLAGFQDPGWLAAMSGIPQVLAA